MFNFKKSKYPRFRIVNNFYRKDFYFLRNAEWSWLDEKSILVTDPQKLEPKILTDWDQVVFILADGTKTIEEYAYFLADQYPEKIPDTLDQLFIFKLLDLEKDNLVILSRQQQQLPKEYELPGLRG